MQDNWIGRSEGLRMNFELDGRSDRLEVFTTRTTRSSVRAFCAISPEHPLAAELAKAAPEIDASSANAGISVPARPPSNAPKKRASIPDCEPVTRSVPTGGFRVYVANFVLMEYGTGAIIGCPAHDQRDLEFAPQIWA